MLKGFEYGQAAYRNPDNVDLSKLDTKSGTDIGGLGGLVDSIKDMVGGMGGAGGGEAALASPEGGAPGGMGDVASLAAAEQTQESDGSGWMSRMFGDNADPSAGDEAMSNPWMVLAARMFGSMYK